MGDWQRQNRDAFNALWRRWYYDGDNAKKKLAWGHRRREDIRAWWRDLKAKLCCEECGESAPECLHFHHIDPATKSFNLGDAASNGRSKAQILSELEKCRVLCANCHLKLHWNQRSERNER